VSKALPAYDRDPVPSLQTIESTLLGRDERRDDPVGGAHGPTVDRPAS
jgi:hypothetical protein